jgi:hypothetical protein
MSFIRGIQPHEIDAVWPQFWALLSLAEEYNAGVPIEEENTLKAIKAGEVQAWVCGDFEIAFTTTIYNTPRGKTLEFVAIGGKNVQEWLWVIDKVAIWAAELDCKRLLASGRKGWTRVLQKAGFETVSYVNERLL